MRGKKHKAVTSAKATASNIVRQKQLYDEDLPNTRKINLILGGALFALQNPSNDANSRSELLLIVRQILLIKCELGLYGGKGHAS